MYRLRLSRRLSWAWRGARYVRGTIYDAPDLETFLAALATGEFVEARPNVEERYPAPRPQEPLEIVVIRNMGLGDVLMLLPLAQEFARRHPNVRVSFATNSGYHELIAAQPGFFRVYNLDTDEIPERSIDMRNFVERHGNAFAVPREELFAEGMGLRLTSAEIRLLRAPLTLNDGAVAEARRAMEPLPRPIVALTARGSTAIRSIHEENHAETVRALLTAGASVALTDSDAPADPCVISFAGRLSVMELAAVLSECDLVIGPDTGVLHLAAHAQRPIVGLFTTWPARLRLSNYDAIALEPDGLLCSPCFDRGCGARWCTSFHHPDEIVLAAARALAPRFRLAIPEGAERSSGWIQFGSPTTKIPDEELAART